MAVTLERLSFAEGIVLARTWRPTVRRQAWFREEECSGGGGATVVADASVELALILVTEVVAGTMWKPCGRRATEEGSSPDMAS